MKTKKRFLSILLSLVMVLGLMPGMNMMALAIPPEKTEHGIGYDIGDISQLNGDPYAALLNTTTVVKFDSKEWYLIKNDSTALNEGTVTLLSKECVAASKYDINGSSNNYSGSTVETAVNNYYTNSISGNVKSAIVDSKMFLLTKEQARTIKQANPEVLKCNKASGASYNAWWLCSPGSFDDDAVCVYGDDGDVYDDGFSVGSTIGVRPALKLNLSSVIFSSVNLSGGANAAISGGTATQNYFDMGNTRGAMTTVTYTANANYKFPETSELYKTTNGITVTRTSDTVITVSGTPTATTTSIAVPDAAIAVTGISLDKTTAQTIDLDGKVSFTATVAPANAKDKTVKWSVGGTNAGAVKLYTDAACTTEVGTDATDKLTVYAKGESAGSATVTVTTNDGAKTASCAVTISQTESEKQTEKQDTTPSGGGGGSIPQTTDPTPAPTPSETVEQPTTTGAPTITQDAFTGISETIALSTDGTASVTSVSGTVGKTLRITGTVNQNGTNHTVSSFATESFSNVDVKIIFIDLKTSGNTQTVTFQPRTFKGSEAKKLTLRLSSSGQVKFSSGALSGSKIKKVVVSGLKKKEFKRVEKKLRKSGYKGKIVKK